MLSDRGYGFEALSLNWNEIDFASGEVHFRPKKNHESRNGRNPIVAFAHLQQYPTEMGRCFAAPAEKKSTLPKKNAGGQIKTASGTASMRAGLSGITPMSCAFLGGVGTRPLGRL